jgi:hypothetical protein
MPLCGREKVQLLLILPKAEETIGVVARRDITSVKNTPIALPKEKPIAFLERTLK